MQETQNDLEFWKNKATMLEQAINTGICAACARYRLCWNGNFDAKCVAFDDDGFPDFILPIKNK